MVAIKQGKQCNTSLCCVLEAEHLQPLLVVCGGICNVLR